MIIGLLVLEIFLPYAKSLKDKRKVLASLKDRIQKKFNVALAELAYQDKWQRAKIGVVTLNSDKTIVEQILTRVLAEAEQIDGEILWSEIQYF